MCVCVCVCVCVCIRACVCACVHLCVRVSTVFFILSELRELVKMHATRDNKNEEPLNFDEVMMM